MRRIYPLFLFALVCLATDARAQSYSESPAYDNLELGIGFGFDYGGLGGNLTIYPQKNIGVFFGGGYAFAGFGYNAGIKARILSSNPSSQFTPFFMAMYGYNAAVHIANASQYDKIFYGPTFGIGCDIGSHEKGKGSFSLALFVPIRTTNPNDYMDELRDNYGVVFKNKIIPIGFSVGYKFNLD
jgi:hypothetical protein